MSLAGLPGRRQDRRGSTFDGGLVWLASGPEHEMDDHVFWLFSIFSARPPSIPDAANVMQCRR